MRKKLLLIYNPHAGKAQIKNKLSDIIDCFNKADYEVTIYATQNVKHAYEIARDISCEYELIVCSGGDGTLDEVVTGLMENDKDNRPIIGYIPSGSTNDFANSLKIPKNMLKAADNIVNGVVFPCDIGSFNGDSFVYIAAFGLFTDVSYQTSQELKNIFGHMAYLLEGVKRLYGIASYDIRFEYDGNVVEDNFIYGMITNSISVGGFKGMTGKNVLLDDGVFEVMMVKQPQNPIELQAIISSLLKEEVDTRYIYSFKTDNLKIIAKDNIPWTLDGEFGGDYNEVDIKVKKKAVNIMVEKGNIEIKE